MSIKMIIFDFDGTIADTLHLLVDVANELAENYGYDKIKNKEIESLKNKNVKQILKERGVSILKIPFLIRKGKGKLDIENAKPFPCIKNLIIKLKNQGYDMGILTSNTKQNIQKFLKKHKIDFFKFIFSGVSIFGKHRKIKKILKKYNLKREEIIYIADEVRDIKAAKKNKIKIISVTWGFNSKKALEKENPDFLVDKPQEIIDVIN